MTKRDRFSFALRRLRNLKAQANIARRIQDTNEIIKEIIDELSKGTKNVDLGQHTTQLLDELYAQNIGAVEDGRLPAPPVMPDCAEQIHAQTRALQAIMSDDDQTRRTETAAVIHHTLSLFAQGPNAAPIEAFLSAFNERVKSANALPLPMPDCAEQIQFHTNALSHPNSTDDPTQARESVVRTLCDTLSVFAQGPNAAPIEAFLETFNDRIKRVNTLPPPMPDCAESIQLQTDTLSHLDGIDNVPQLLEALVNTLCHTLSVFAQGPNELPVQTFLGRVQQTTSRANTLTPPVPDYSTHLQSDLDRLEELVDPGDPESMGDAEITVLCHALSVFAQGPNEEPIQTLLATVEKLNKQKELCPRLPDDTQPLQSHIEALTALEGLDDPEALTAAAALTLYEALAGMAQGPHEAPIRALLDTFDKVTGAA